VEDWRRSPGSGRYARPERERRFLVVGSPPREGPARLIEDRYLTGTSLRLRRVRVGGDTVHKLTQKVRVRGDDPFEVALTNTYLERAEYALLRELPAGVLRKTRYICDVEGVRFAVDEFHGALAGLLLAEVEVTSSDQLLPAPRWRGAEVSHDDRYSGGRLAQATALELIDLGLGGPSAARRA
jgi:CYTH domain-containing protein